LSRTFSANTDHLDAATDITDVPFTLSCWYKLPSDKTGQIMYSMALGVAGTTNNLYWIDIHTNMECGEKDTVASTAATNLENQSTAHQYGIWRVMTGVFATHSSRSIYLDGTSKSTNSATRTTAAVDSIRISGDLATTPSVNTPFQGSIAHAAIWNIALSDQQVASLLYLYPNQVAVANLVHYWPLLNNQSPEPDYGSGNLPLTVNGTTFSSSNPNIAMTASHTLMGGSAG
jgi:hypothetical protein